MSEASTGGTGAGRDELAEALGRLGFPLDGLPWEELEELGEYVLAQADAFMAENADEVAPEAGRDARPRRPSPTEDPLNAILHWCDVPGTGDGPLRGVRVAVKDIISVAGVPMTSGSAMFADAVPTRDAEVVRRVLAAGGSVVATTNLEDMCMSAGGETSAYGTTLNPFDLTRTASGSSGGSAAAVWYDGIDVALGTDQGGSVRLPASWCGVLGLKPTFGLVPYAGIGSMDRSLDHCGPLTRTTREMATLMDVLAGPSPDDSRQAGTPGFDQDFGRAVAEAPDDLRGLRVGVVREGRHSGTPGAEGTDAAFLGAVEQLRELGATVDEVDLPEHAQGNRIMFAILVEGLAATAYSLGEGRHWRGGYRPDLAAGFASAIHERGHLGNLTYLAMVGVGEHLRVARSGEVYARAQNAIPRITAGYDRALSERDLLVMPTAVHAAHLAAPDVGPVQRAMRGWSMVGNTNVHNATGHPALSIPMAEHDGLPVGLMAVHRRGHDAELLRVAATIESTLGWRPAGGPAPLG